MTDCFCLHFNSECTESLDEIFVVWPTIEAKFPDVDFRKLDPSIRNTLFYQTLLGVGDLNEHGMVHGDLQPERFVIITLDPPKARLASSKYLHKVQTSEKKELSMDMIAWASTIALALTGEKQLNSDDYARLLREHSKQYPYDASLVDLLLSILEQAPNTDCTSEQALMHACWDDILE